MGSHETYISVKILLKLEFDVDAQGSMDILENG